IRFPTLSEVYDKIDDQQTDAADKMKRALDEARELAKQTEELKRELQQAPGRDRREDAAGGRAARAVEPARGREPGLPRRHHGQDAGDLEAGARSRLARAQGGDPQAAGVAAAGGS